MATFTVECGVEHYRIIGPNGEQGERVCWDGIDTLKLGNEIYYCDGDSDADEQTVECVVTSRAEPTVIEDVQFDDETAEEGDGNEDGDSEDEDEDEEDEEEFEPGPELVK